MIKTVNQPAFKVASVLLLILSFSVISFGQNQESGEQSAVNVPEQIMQQIVRRILIWSFKPRKKTKIIYLAKRIGRTEKEISFSWLPEIQNIDFRLLSDKEIEKQNEDLYFFTSPDQDGNRFSIGFAFGTHNCDYFGENWDFRILRSKVRLWQSGGVGGACASDF